MRITSKTVFLGLPVFEFAVAEVGASPHLKGPACAWVAIGDLALSPFLAIGGLAFGTVSFGGLALGGLAIGGCAIGGLALGGCSIGVWAMGGLALGLQAAKGGLAASPGYALGGAAFGPQANTREAAAWFARAPFWMVPPGRIFLLFLPLALLPVLVRPRAVKGKDRGITPR
ncbi:hypothetical protein [Geothrix sp. SG200]|uniref:hypothetical protein n=1 Tax=Geothrix sp. SG200 TaxID=2922865 RepID=UPI001FACB6CF|nr:hypothetical protein [Geothrix sp. SG200]